MKKILKPIFLIVFAVLIPFYLKGLVELILLCLKNLRTANVQSFCTGLGLGLGLGVLSIFFARHKDSLWLVFEHELTHLVTGKLCGKKITEMHIGLRGGYVRLSGTNILISLSPYCFPLLAYVALLFIQVIRSSLYTTGIAAVGFLLGQHIVTGKRQIHRGQSDLNRYGFVFSLVFIILFSVLFYGFLIAVVTGEFSNGTKFLVSGVELLLVSSGIL